MKTLRATLPWPPSMNRIWRSVVIRGAVRVLLSKEGRQYRQAVAGALAVSRQSGAAFLGPVSLRIDAYQPDRRRRDVDNLSKAVLDALTRCSVWNDDYQVVDLRIVKHAPDGNPRIEVEISEVVL